MFQAYPNITTPWLALSDLTPNATDLFVSELYLEGLGAQELGQVEAFVAAGKAVA